ncbi:MAG: GNAT family N-acetyltransferase, partial [Chloroflexota bacterium]
MAITCTTLTKKYAQKAADLINICFPAMPDDRYFEEELVMMADVFAEGSIIAINEANDQVVGFGTGLFLDVDWRNLPETENEMLGEHGLANHNPKGKFYYGTEFCVHPDFRSQGIGRRIYDQRKEVAVRNNKLGFFAASVLQGYVKYKDSLDIETYIDQVKNGQAYDPTLTMQLRNNFQVIKPIQYFFDHAPSDHWTAFIYWGNP